MEFSNPPQSISIIHDLPIGPLQNIAVAQMIESSAPTREQKMEDLPTVEQESPQDVTPEIIVEKKETKKKQNKKTLKQDNIVKKLNHPNKVKKKALQNKSSPITQAGSSGAETATAPPTGNSDKIAAEFNSSGNSNDILANWRGLIKSRLERSLKYPEQALRKRWKGKPKIRILIDREGKVISVEIDRSSGKREFDIEAVNNAKRSSPLPKPPAELIKDKSTLSLTVPISFDYEKHRL